MFIAFLLMRKWNLHLVLLGNSYCKPSILHDNSAGLSCSTILKIHCPFFCSKVKCVQQVVFYELYLNVRRWFNSKCNVLYSVATVLIERSQARKVTFCLKICIKLILAILICVGRMEEKYLGGLLILERNKTRIIRSIILKMKIKPQRDQNWCKFSHTGLHSLCSKIFSKRR